MNLDTIRAICTSLPQVTEKVQWGDDLVFKVGGKMFCVAYLGVPTHLSFRPSDEHRIDLLEIEGVIQPVYGTRRLGLGARDEVGERGGDQAGDSRVLRLLFCEAAEENPGATPQQEVEEENLI